MVARSPPRFATRWTMPCANRNSAVWNVGGSVWRSVCSITRGPAKPTCAPGSAIRPDGILLVVVDDDPVGHRVVGVVLIHAAMLYFPSRLPGRAGLSSVRPHHHYDASARRAPRTAP